MRVVAAALNPSSLRGNQKNNFRWKIVCTDVFAGITAQPSAEGMHRDESDLRD